MALGIDAIQLLILLKQNGYFLGEASVIELGAQQLATSFLDARDELDAIAGLFDTCSPCPLPEAKAAAGAPTELEPLARSAPYARDFWRWLGFRYTALDFDGPDSIPLDLNYDSAPPELAGSFRLVTNFGTTEHVANQLNAFKVIHDLAVPAGLMIHQVPFQGMLNHGLVNYNFKFFWMLCRGNNYRIIAASLSGAGHDFPLPQNIVDGIAPFDPAIFARQAKYKFYDATLTIVLQKIADLPFVAPVDVPTETWATNTLISSRYAPPALRMSNLPEDILHYVSGWDLQRELLHRYRLRLTRWLR